MSVSLVTSPFKWSWAKNRNHFVFQCDSLKTVGSKSNFSIRLSSVSIVRNADIKFVMVIDGQRYVWKHESSPDGVWEFSTNVSLANKIQNNYYIKQLYTVDVESQGIYKAIAFNAHESGMHTIDVFFEKATGERISDDMAGLTVGHISEGDDPDKLTNYSLAVSIDVLANDFNNVKIGTTGWMFFQPDESGRVDVPIDAICSFIPQPDIPSFAEPFSLQLMTNHFMKYKIRWAEVWGDTPRLQEVNEGDWMYAFCGEVSDYHHRLNLPDWQDAAPAVRLSSAQRAIFRVIGEDSGKIVDVHASQPEFLTLFYYDQQVDINASASMRVRLDKTDQQGRTTTTWIVHTVKNGNEYRLSVGPSAVSATSSSSYTITLCENENEPQFSRTFRIVPDFYNQHIFLLQSKWGNLTTLCIPTISVNIVTEGDILQMRNRHYVGLTNRYQSFSAVSAALRKEEALRIERSLASEYHYLQHNGAWNRIVVEPATFECRNEDEDMVAIGFSFRFVENQGDNLPTNSALSTSNQQLVTANIVDDAGAYVSFGVRMTPQSNALHDE